MSKEFFDKYPDVFKEIVRYERTDSKGDLIESWERNEDGEMINVTSRDMLREEITNAKSSLIKLEIQTKEVIHFPYCPEYCPHYITHTIDGNTLYVCTKMQKRCDDTNKDALIMPCTLSKNKQIELLSQEEL